MREREATLEDRAERGSNMTDEATIETQEEVQEVPQKSPEDIAREYLEAQGIDFKKAKNLAEWERDVNKRSSELGSIAKQLEQAQPVKESAPEFDPEELNNLKAALKQVGIDPDAVNRAVQLTQVTVTEQIDATADRFFAAHPDVTPDELIAEMVDSGVDVKSLTPARLEKALTKAHKSIVASKTDIDALVQSKLEAEIAKLKGKDEEIVSVKKGTGSGGGKTPGDVIDDPNLSPFEKMRALQDYTD